jgi:flavin-dependent dehydrogenase
VKADVEAHYMSSLDFAPAFKEEVLSGKREERFYGTGHVPNYFRKPYGPGWALVGDSAYHKDPILGQGITDALRDASLLAGALDDVFACRATWESALSGYESARNAAVRDIYEMNCQFAALDPPPPHMQALLQALRDNPDEISQFMGTMTGAVSIPEFYREENVRRILGAAQQQGICASAA